MRSPARFRSGWLLIGVLLALLLSAGVPVGTPAQAMRGSQPVARPASVAASIAAARPAGSSTMFVENVGQFGDGARFRVYGGGPTLWLAEDAVWVTASRQSSAVSRQSPLPLPGPDPLAPSPGLPHPLAPSPPGGEGERGETGVALRVSFPGANPSPVVEPFDRLETKVSYFLGNDPTNWRPDVPVWGGVRYRDLYPGVDLELLGEGGRWSWRLVARGSEALALADAEAALAGVRLQVEGADDVRVESGSIRLGTAVGDVRLPLLATVAADGSPLPFVGEGPGVMGNTVVAPFATPGARAAVRPAGASDLVYSTFLGGSSFAGAIAVDGSGAAYVAGSTNSSDFPTTAGVYDTSFNGAQDVFVAKLNPSGTGLVYSAFLGGLSDEWGTGIAIDETGAAYVTGETQSSDFPATAGAYNTSVNSGSHTVFVAKLDMSGTALAYGTFLGSMGS